MPDIINLLPDSLANQIAAGEVVQRPASVVKELLENSIDAGAARITLRVSDGGRAGIEVQDDGRGMSATDARLCFERHATSKIASSSDLEAITTMGFRGEALASIAAVAEVTLTTRRAEDELGYRITLSGSRVVGQSPVSCAKGAHFSVRNLFFNVPARRRFLKSTSVEMKHVVSEFQRVAIANPGVSMTLTHDGTPMYVLGSSNRYQRIVGLFGRRIEQALVPVSVSTDTVAIEGYIGKPTSARQRGGEQFLFVNGRFMRSGYLNRAIVDAYGKLIGPGANPIFFLHFAVPPESIDVNIHPTKTEVKFQDERHIWQLLHAGVRESLGKYGGLPLIDFDREASVNVGFYPGSAPVIPPEVGVDTSYNPFEGSGSGGAGGRGVRVSSLGGGGDVELDSYAVEEMPTGTPSLYEEVDAAGGGLRHELDDTYTLQFRRSYIVTPLRSGLAFIDQHRAHARILYEELQRLPVNLGQSQQLLYPARVSLTPEEALQAEELVREAASAGIMLKQEGADSLLLLAYPPHLSISDPEGFVQDLLAYLAEDTLGLGAASRQKHLAAISFASAIRRGSPLSAEARMDLLSRLFSCDEPSVDPYMRPLIHVLSDRSVADFFTV